MANVDGSGKKRMTLHQSPRVVSKNELLIAFIQQQFNAGKWLVEIKSDDPMRLRKSLYELMRRRDLNWTFSIRDKSVFAIRSRATL